MHRFFTQAENISNENQTIILDDKEDVKHIQKVLRLKVGDEIEVCNGQAMEYRSEIIELDSSTVTLKIKEQYDSLTESPLKITLFQGMPKSSKMDMILQKCTELGIGEIIPVVTKRSVVQIKDQKNMEKKLQRWEKIIYSAAKQSKRGVIPNIAYPMTLKEAFKKVLDYDLAVIPYEQEKSMGMKEILSEQRGPKKVAIFIGPEGGFEEEEIMDAKDHKVFPVSLGPRILRTETAGFVAVSMIMYEVGDLGGC